MLDAPCPTTTQRDGELMFCSSGEMQRASVGSRCLGFLNSVCGLADHIKYEAGVGEHGNVAAVDLSCGCAHTLRNEAFQIGMDGAVVLGHDVPARLRPPGDAVTPLREQVRHGHGLG